MVIEVEESSGNVFRDLGLDEPELLLAKSTLIIKIHAMMVDHGWTERATAKLLGVTTRDVHEMIRGDLDRYSETELKRFVKTLRSFVNGSQNGKHTSKKTAKVAK
jgi:predicted XRE-type DNA-binding protein